MKPGVFRTSVAGMVFNISFFKCLHMLVCKIYVVIIHNRSSLFFLLNKYCTEGQGSEVIHLKISNALRVGVVLIFFWANRRKALLPDKFYSYYFLQWLITLQLLLLTFIRARQFYHTEGMHPLLYPVWKPSNMRSFLHWYCFSLIKISALQSFRLSHPVLQSRQ